MAGSPGPTGGFWEVGNSPWCSALGRDPTDTPQVLTSPQRAPRPPPVPSALRPPPAGRPWPLGRPAGLGLTRTPFPDLKQELMDLRMMLKKRCVRACPWGGGSAALSPVALSPPGSARPGSGTGGEGRAQAAGGKREARGRSPTALAPVPPP